MNNICVNNYSAFPTPTPTTIPTSSPISNETRQNEAEPHNPPAVANISPNEFQFLNGQYTGQYQFAAQALLKTVYLSLDEIKNWAILDSGATSHFLVTQAPAINIRPTQRPITARIPDGSTITSTKEYELDLPSLPKKAREAHIIPGLANYSLVSVTKLCNAGCEVHMSMIGCTITYRGSTVLCASKCKKTGLWMIPLTPSTADHPPNLMHELAHNVVETSTKSELAQYIHQSLCSPPKPTLLSAIKNSQLRSIPGLTYELISKHLPPSTATDKGHLSRIRQGIRSTRSNKQAIQDARAEVNDMAPSEEICHTTYPRHVLFRRISRYE